MSQETAKLLRFAFVLAALLLAVFVVGMEYEEWSSRVKSLGNRIDTVMGRQPFQCPPTWVETRNKLSGRPVADLRLDNGEVVCFLEHMAKKLKMVDQKGRF